MKLNQYIKIIGSKIILVSYKKEHVPKYNEWMKNEELLRLTASDPLTLQEEYVMQQTWLNDDNKCTFIILSKDSFESSHDEVESMVGDVNLFISVNDDKCKEAEIEIMIAEKNMRGRGLGQEAIVAIMYYAYKNIGVQKFVAKISSQNRNSISLFIKLGYIQTSMPNIFDEITMEFGNDDEQWEQLEKNYLNCTIFNCN